jgi:chromosome segregation ATPase
MEKETNLTYEERLKERKSVLWKINEARAELKDLNKKISDLEKEVEKSKEEKQDVEKKVLNLQEQLIKKAIPVPKEGDYEIRNGLLGAKRDLNLKLIKNLNDKSIRQVFIYIFSFFIIWFVLDVRNK